MLTIRPSFRNSRRTPGATWLIGTGTPLITYVIPAIWLGTRPQFQIEHVWYLSVATVAVQTVVSLVLLRSQLRVRLAPLERPLNAPQQA